MRGLRTVSHFVASKTTDKIEVEVETLLTLDSEELSISGPSSKASSACSESELSEFLEVKKCGSGRLEEGLGWPESEMESEVDSELEGIMKEEVGVEIIEVVWLVTKVW